MSTSEVLRVGFPGLGAKPSRVLASEAQARDATAPDVFVLGGVPIREPMVGYGPFVMNSREEVVHAIEGWQSGRLGTIPAEQIAPRHFA